MCSMNDYIHENKVNSLYLNSSTKVKLTSTIKHKITSSSYISNVNILNPNFGESDISKDMNNHKGGLIGNSLKTKKTNKIKEDNNENSSNYSEDTIDFDDEIKVTSNNIIIKHINKGDYKINNIEMIKSNRNDVNSNINNNINSNMSNKVSHKINTCRELKSKPINIIMDKEETIPIKKYSIHERYSNFFNNNNNNVKYNHSNKLMKRKNKIQISNKLMIKLKDNITFTTPTPIIYINSKEYDFYSNCSILNSDVKSRQREINFDNEKNNTIQVNLKIHKKQYKSINKVLYNQLKKNDYKIDLNSNINNDNNEDNKDNKDVSDSIINTDIKVNSKNELIFSDSSNRNYNTIEDKYLKFPLLKIHYNSFSNDSYIEGSPVNYDNNNNNDNSNNNKIDNCYFDMLVNYNFFCVNKTQAQEVIINNNLFVFENFVYNNKQEKDCILSRFNIAKHQNDYHSTNTTNSFLIITDLGEYTLNNNSFNSSCSNKTNINGNSNKTTKSYSSLSTNFSLSKERLNDKFKSNNVFDSNVFIINTNNAKADNTNTNNNSSNSYLIDSFIDSKIVLQFNDSNNNMLSCNALYNKNSNWVLYINKQNSTNCNNNNTNTNNINVINKEISYFWKKLGSSKLYFKDIESYCHLENNNNNNNDSNSSYDSSLSLIIIRIPALNNKAIYIEKDEIVFSI